MWNYFLQITANINKEEITDEPKKKEYFISYIVYG